MGFQMRIQAVRLGYKSIPVSGQPAQTILTDIQVRPLGFDVCDVHASHLPDLSAQRPVILFGKWRGPAGGTFELQGKTGDGDYLTRLEVGGVQPDDANRALRYLWARSRIAELSDYGVSHLDADQIGNITSLGLKYNLLTQYTSFIVVREMVSKHEEAFRSVPALFLPACCVLRNNVWNSAGKWRIPTGN
jgi:hypothetical protein